MDTDPVVIVGARRTPLGSFQGALSEMAAPVLGGIAARAALEQAGVVPAAVSELLMGCVLQAGVGQAPARQAGMAAGLPPSVPATTINKVCGSAMKAVMLAHDQLLLGGGEIMLAGGMESMSRAPYLLAKARGGMRLGHGQVLDHLFLDGIEDAYEPGRSMGSFADATAAALEFSRAEQDAYARGSIARARAAIAEGRFARELAAVPGCAEDEGPARARPERIATLKPAFGANGTVTAASSASISDGAAALVLMRRSRAEARGIPPLATIRAHASFAGPPEWFTTAPISAIRGVLDRSGWSAGQVDLFEINEAFAVVPMAAMRQLELPAERVNIHGGACVLGHPLGASGARILVTLLAALESHGLRRGVAALCIGGGEATAIAVERA